MSRLPADATVITTRAGDVPVAPTVSSVTALSLGPLQLLAGVRNPFFTRRADSRHGGLGVTVLGEDAELPLVHCCGEFGGIA
jgi:flavin reductase (DIM6/NTAB) family NADH-FMN oxidoreductase RutF